MAFLKFTNYSQLSEALADLIIERIEKSDSCQIGLSTGFSPKLAYSFIAQQLAQNPSLIPKIKGFQIDEWLGLSKKDPSSCSNYIYENIIIPWKFNPDQCFLIDGQHSDQEAQIMEMKKSLTHKPLDICILGLGKNGHLALNEPGSKLEDSCRIVELAPSSKNHNMLLESDFSVHKGITIGLKEILAAKEIILIITGEGKKEGYQNLLERKPVEAFPASAIYHHHNWTCFVDESSVL